MHMTGGWSGECIYTPALLAIARGEEKNCGMRLDYLGRSSTGSRLLDKNSTRLIAALNHNQHSASRFAKSAGGLGELVFSATVKGSSAFPGFSWQLVAQCFIVRWAGKTTRHAIRRFAAPLFACRIFSVQA